MTMIASSWALPYEYPYRVTRIKPFILGVESAKVEGVPGAPLPQQSVPRAERATHCVVGGAHAFILRISSVVGLAPLRFESHGAGYTVSISSAMCVYSYILVTVLVICTILGLAAELNVGTQSVRMQTRMLQVASCSDVLVVVATAGAGIYGAPRRMRNMLKFMEDIAMVDSSIGSQYSAVAERKLCLIILASLIVFSVLVVDDFAFYVVEGKKLDREWDVLINYIAFYALWFVVMILELQFAFTALSVRSRFTAVNDALALTARQASIPVEKPKSSSTLNIYAIRVSPADSQRSANVSLLVNDSMSGREQVVIIKRTASGEPRLVVSPCDAVRRLAALHGTLCDVVTSIDASYGLPLIVILISTLLHLIVTPYFVIMEILVSTNRPHFLFLQFLWCTTHMLRMIGVVEPGHLTIAEGKRTEGIISRLMTSAPSTGVLPARLEIFSRQLMLQSVSYSPMGMCTLHRPLIASVLGAVTTYLVILIQFQRYDS
ncbi:gustatory receptor for sugar taste 43a-like [Trichoplusia ni]|uniref:Gustatory receptor n=1 Tax=Trichoplusia ni TaxID=7111 RepID=A0A7E5WJU9_TRINI|nr:gustatory receptor for sugar taste 43a-like [Trichoplusia ni]